jgi:hypothetical protein
MGLLKLSQVECVFRSDRLLAFCILLPAMGYRHFISIIIIIISVENLVVLPVTQQSPTITAQRGPDDTAPFDKAPMGKIATRTISSFKQQTR